jgi:hypothetical protein
MTVKELYTQTIKPLTAAERLQLAKLIINDIPDQAMTDYSDAWSTEDLPRLQSRFLERR